MRPALQRTQILLEPDQHTALTTLAKRQGRSLSDLIRQIVDQELARDENQKTRRLEALEKIQEHRQEILASRSGRSLDIDVVEMIEEMRTERDQEIEQVLRNRH